MLHKKKKMVINSGFYASYVDETIWSFWRGAWRRRVAIHVEMYREANSSNVLSTTALETCYSAKHNNITKGLFCYCKAK